MGNPPAGRSRSAPGPAIAYIVEQFPSVWESFVTREMLMVEEMGFRVIPLALSAPEQEPVPSAARKLTTITIYCPPLVSAAMLFCQLAAAVRYPVGYFSALTLLLRLATQHPRHTRELVASLLTAGCFAARLSLRLRHIHCQFGGMPATVGMLLAEMLGLGYSVAFHTRDIFAGQAILVAHKIAEAEFVTVCTDYGLRRLLRQHQLVATDKIYLIYHGTDTFTFRPVTRQPSPEPLLLSVGRLVEKKGFPILLRACALLRRRGVDLRLCIVGDGPDKADLERQAAGLGLADYVQFAEPMPQERLCSLYAAADVFVLASVVAENGDRDGLPDVLVEALAMGIPTVASNLGAIPELIENEKTGLLARPGDPTDLADKLERAIYDEVWRDRVSRHGREKVLRQFDARRNLQVLGALFREAMAPPRRPTRSVQVADDGP